MLAMLIGCSTAPPIPPIIEVKPPSQCLIIPDYYRADISLCSDADCIIDVLIEGYVVNAERYAELKLNHQCIVEWIKLK